MDEFLVYSVATTTGDDRTLIGVSNFDWERALSAGAYGTCDFPLDNDFTKEQRRYLVEEWKRTIVLEHNGVVVFAGIVRASDYDKNKRVTSLALIDLWGMWGRRGAWDHNEGNVELWSVTYTSASLALLAKRAVERGTTADAAPVIELPITLPSVSAGSLTRTYHGFRLEFVIEVLDALMAEGLNIDFEPRWVDGKLDWLMRMDPEESFWEWHADAPDGGVTAFRLKSDGARMTNNAVNVGEGSDENMLARSNRDLDSEFPLLERVTSHKLVDDGDQLAAMSTQDLVTYSSPTKAWSFDVLASGKQNVDGEWITPTLGELRLGDTVRLWFDGDPLLEDGFYTRSIVKLSGGMGEQVRVTLQTTGGA